MIVNNFKYTFLNFFKSVKHMLMFVNVLFSLTGIVLLLTGTMVLGRYSQYEELTTSRFFKLGGFVIATAVIIIFGSLIGFYVANSRQFYIFSAYLMVLILILVFEISITIFAFGLSDDTFVVIRTTLGQSLQLYGTNIEIIKLWDHLQRELQCCGVTSSFSWNRIPDSCCPRSYGTISSFECNWQNSYMTGCATALGEYLAYQTHVIAVVALIMAFIQAILTALGGYLAWLTRTDELVELNYLKQSIGHLNFVKF